MSFWEWDVIGIIKSRKDLRIESDGIIPRKIRRQEIRRNNHEIEIETESPEILENAYKGIALGQFINGGAATISSHFESGEITGIYRKESKTTYLRNDEVSAIDVFKADSVSIRSNHGKEISHIVDRVANLPTAYIWPSTFEEETISKKTRKFQNKDPFTVTEELKRKNFSRTCIYLTICGIEVIIGKSESSESTADNPGYIIYKEAIEEAIRSKIRDSISFAFGIPIVYFGHTCHDAQGQTIELHAVSPHTVGGRAWEIAQNPPAPITSNHGRTNLIDEIAFNRVVECVFNKIEDYRLDNLIWRLWYAESAPYFMRPAYYGALIESIQETHIEKNKKTIPKTVIEKTRYKKPRDTIARYIKSLKIDEESKKIFIEKLINGNSASQKIISGRFYESLDLEVGDLEKSAWQRRNDAAHGNNIPTERANELIRETNALKNMLNRIILRITSGSDLYHDYFTYGFPARPIRKPIPQETKGDS